MITHTESILTRFVLDNASNLLFNEEVSKHLIQRLNTKLEKYLSEEEKNIIQLLFVGHLILSEKREKRQITHLSDEEFSERADFIVSHLKNFLGLIDGKLIKEVQANTI